MTTRARMKVVWWRAVLFATAIPLFCWGQESTNVPSATQPAAGRFALKEKLSLLRLRDDPSPADRTIDQFLSTTTLTYGILRDLSASLELPLYYSFEKSGPADARDGDFGAADLTLLGKWRPLQLDLGPLDTLRLAFLGGVEIPTYDEDFSSEGFDPLAGAVFSTVLDRHGFNQAVRYKFNTNGKPFTTRPGDGEADALFYDTSYLFRIVPGTYSVDSGAAYLMVELNGLYETNGDHEILVAPGFMYEGTGFAVEFSVGLPVLDEVDRRPEVDVIVSIGFRLLF